MAFASLLSSTLALLVGSILLLYLIYRFLVYPAVLSPLSRIPNAHWLAPISLFWILLVRFQRRENRTLRRAHQRLGPFVRVGPNEISIDDVEAVKAVYQGGFDKTSWYSIFDNYGVPCMFSAQTSREHSLRKRMVSNVYSKSFIQSSEALRAQARIILYERLLAIVQESTAESQKPHGIDVHSLFQAASMDFISAYIFGIRHSTDFLNKPGYREHWLQLYNARATYPFFNQELPWLTKSLSRLGIRLYPSWVDTVNKELEDWNRSMCVATLADDVALAAAGAAGASSSPADEAVVTRVLLAGLEREKEAGTDSILYSAATRYHDLSVASELFDQVLAGHETVGITLTYLVWHLSKSRDLQQSLHTELVTMEPNVRKDVTSNPKMLDSLKLLDAVLMETLRLHAAIPGPQPRAAPYPSCQLGPYTIPGGTRVSALAHTMHRDEKAFPDPENWDHTRWLADKTDEEKRKAMNRQFWAFGSGGRMCLGSNFAIHEMKHIVAAIYSNFTTHIVDDAGMEQVDGYTVGPQSGRLFVRFEPIQ
ncbi:cytochrome P450 3A12 [Magnaporthiopsis poae ATCC 64411]|uniref:Cytochrome P450 3A12 n=1 Tax=Magnaporthiopsis poae (strain ATCC 64411 / 73-15) TaxID=644358 RepID=A0A0C4E358_MAGP6|nr:cytochrome P450 3A12 [Magnaporthiopsis poae ATCC 64411]